MTWNPDMDNVEMDAWRYSGDVNLEEGGLFWKPIGDDMADAVEVHPLPGNPSADYEDEAWRIGWDGHIYMNPDQMKSNVGNLGYEVHSDGFVNAQGNTLTGDDAYAVMVDAYYGHVGMEGHQIITVTRADLTEAGLTLHEYVSEHAEMGPNVPATRPEPEELPSP
jgi:hypothetical protein